MQIVEIQKQVLCQHQIFCRQGIALGGLLLGQPSLLLANDEKRNQNIIIKKKKNKKNISLFLNCLIKKKNICGMRHFLPRSEVH